MPWKERVAKGCSGKRLRVALVQGGACEDVLGPPEDIRKADLHAVNAHFR